MRKYRLFLFLLSVCLLLTGCSAPDSLCLAKAEYPQLTDVTKAYEKAASLTPEDWADPESASAIYGEYADASFSYMQELFALQDSVRDDCPDLTEFAAATAAELFALRNENTVYSPVSLYLALGMLAEATDGSTREEITVLLGTKDFRTAANALFKMVYQAGIGQTYAANSLWGGKTVPVKQTLADTLAEYYFADTYVVPMGTAVANKAMQNWLNEHTGGMLQDAAETVTSEEDTVLALMSTIYFKQNWMSKFSPSATSDAPFTLADGSTVTAAFMHDSDTGSYCRGANYTAVQRGFEEAGGRMVFVLPDEGVLPEELLSDPRLFSRILQEEYDRPAVINWSLPKFDVSSNLDLTQPLQAMGITAAFDPAVSDFTPTTEAVNIYLNQAKHAARVTVNEDGCTASAFTVLMGLGAGMPPTEQLDFRLDRPFLFIIEGNRGIPLFIGTVYTP